MAKEKDVNVGIILEIYSIELKFFKAQGKNIHDHLKKIKLKLPLLEDETSINDSHLSDIKEDISELLYFENNYKECARYLCDCFLENSKFGKNSEALKNMLKINVLVLLMSGDKDLLDSKIHNPLKHDSKASFKMDNDIQAIYGLIEAFNSLNLDNFR